MTDRPTEAKPIERKVTRFICPFCRRGRSKRSYAQEHIDQCWKNPAQRSCGSCANFRSGSQGGYDEPGCDPYCAVGAEIHSADGDKQLVRLCPSWEPSTFVVETALRDVGWSI